jgi:tight adherence protein B
MDILVPAVLIFAVTVFIIEMLLYAYRTARNPHRRKVRRRLQRLASEDYPNRSAAMDIVKKERALSDVRLLDRLLRLIPGVKRLDRLVQQANAPYPLGMYLLLSAALLVICYLASGLVLKSDLVRWMAGGAAACLPIFYLRFKKRKRMEKFERQLPEAMELIGRALRAGHAFTSGMRLAADEFDDPLGPEFDAALHEINFGVAVPDALKHLAQRIDCQDLRYFVVSVILQRETGGNLADIIDSIAYLIRERFKFRGKVRTLSAEGKLSAMILSALPFLVIIALQFTNPDYMTALFAETSGQIIAGIATFMMIMGILVMKKMVNIRV